MKISLLFMLLILMFSLFLFSSDQTDSYNDKESVSSKVFNTKKTPSLTSDDRTRLEAVKFNENWRSSPDKEDWQKFSFFDGQYVEMTIGLDDQNMDAQKALGKLLSDVKGKIVDQTKIKGLTNAFVVKVPFDSIQAFSERASGMPNVKYVEPSARVEADYVPNDPDWSKQWGPADIQADFAWNTTVGSSSVLVAVVDTGIDYTHPDLQANYVPLGYDWVNNDTDPMDDHGHGTHVAGIIAATIDNNEGIAGIAQVRVMAEKGLSASGSGSDENLAKAIIHATDQGARIISMSWGAYFDSEILHDALRYAYSRDVLLVAAAGNDQWPLYHFPAVYDEVVAVAATNRSDTIASFSTYGDWVDASAPGVQIYSAISKNHTMNRNYPYDNLSGTSMATPHVSGTAALLWSQFPDLTRDEVQLRICSTADDLGDAGFDPHFGHGRINAKHALEPQPDHELILWKWKHRPYAKLNQINNFTISVLNYGKNGEENVVINLLVNSSTVDSKLIPYLASNTIETITLTWNPTVEAIFNVTASVTPVTGEKTTNNAVSVLMMAGSRISLRVPQDYPTIQQAVDAAIPGDTIEVAAGKYNEFAIVTTSGLRFVGENMYTTIIDGNNTGTSPFLLLSVKEISITGFTLQNGWDVGLFNVGAAAEYFNISHNILQGSHGSVLLVGNHSLINGNLLISSKIGVSGYFNLITNNVGGSIEFGGGNSAASGNQMNGHAWVGGKGNTASHNVVSGSMDYSAFRVEGEENVITDNEVTDAFYNGFYVTGRNHFIARNEIMRTEASGILMEEADENRIQDNTIVGSSFSRAVYLVDACNNNTVLRNVIENTFDGIDVVRSNNNAFSENFITNSSNAGIYLLLSNSSSLTSGTVVSESRYGLYIGYSKDNLIAENVTLLDNEYGVFLENTLNTRIYHNNFLDNTNQVSLISAISNVWDYNGKGNYWSDYTGIDANSDGIGDTPFTIDANNQDRYPLMKPWAIMHDVAIRNIVSSKTIVAQGYTVHVNVTVENTGGYIETIDITAYANSIQMATITRTLTGGSSATITLIWNTTDAVKGEYAITAQVKPVSGETNTEDNTLTDGSIRVAMAGDLTGSTGAPDGRVDIQDLAIIAKAYGSYPGQPNWNPNGDIDDNGKVEIQDLAIAAKNYGKTDP